MTSASKPAGADVVVIGGGLHGLSSALHLARRGARVVVLERDMCGRHASGVNAGGVRTLGRHDAEIALSLASRDLWVRLAELVGDDAGFVPSGQLKVAESEAELAECSARVVHLQSLGFRHEVMVDACAVRDLVPSLARHVVGGIWVEHDGHALPFRAVTAFRLAAQKAGVEIREQCAVRRIEHRDGQWDIESAGGRWRAPQVVNAAGAWAGEFARQAGEPVRVEPRGLMLMVTQSVPAFVKPVLGATGRPLSFKQFSNGTVVIGGALECTADVTARQCVLDFPQLGTSAHTVTDLFPHLQHVVVNRAWAGIEGFMPDGIPVISRSSTHEGLVHAFGFSAHGFELGPIVGSVVAELVCEGRSTHDIDAFRIGRFAAAAHPQLDAH
ncbi:FAD-binding oxidoreductase [Paraburkholderia fungorum]|uniref:NAD(P)/FAD-dependent oxidoreductase n=1 Tax=Paraburkholderia fungorum TaxID=134537 RepID=UPI0038BC6C0B